MGDQVNFNRDYFSDDSVGGSTVDVDIDRIFP